jgi:tetratricopeptide (TPR) repeat protein
MEMRLSDNDNYRRYMLSRANDDLRAATEHLKACLQEVRGVEHEAAARAFILQEIGNLMLLQGAESEAFDYYHEALEADPDSLLPRLQFATFLAKLGRLSEAIGQCDQIIQSALMAPTPESEDDFGSEYYIRKAREIIEGCRSQQEGC